MCSLPALPCGAPHRRQRTVVHSSLRCGAGRGAPEPNCGENVLMPAEYTTRFGCAAPTKANTAGQPQRDGTHGAQRAAHQAALRQTAAARLHPLRRSHDRSHRPRRGTADGCPGGALKPTCRPRCLPSALRSASVHAQRCRRLCRVNLRRADRPSGPSVRAPLWQLLPGG